MKGQSHEEVQYYWTERHLLRNKMATLVTTRSSGSSYLNRVELQNGCLSRGHSSTFIPSTLAGSCMDRSTIDMSKLQDNMDSAIETYINRVDGCPCGDSVICLFRGADSTEQQKIQDKLLVFLKASNASKKALCQQEPTLSAQSQLPGHGARFAIVHIFPHVLLQKRLPTSSLPSWSTQEQAHMVPWWPIPVSATAALFPIMNGHGAALVRAARTYALATTGLSL